MFKLLVFFACAFMACNGDAPATPPVRCGKIPDNLYRCMGNPHVIKGDVAVQCKNTASECAKLKCIFEKSGWMKGQKVDKPKVSAYFDQFAKDHPEWSPAVQQVKTSCLTVDLPAQGTTLNCPAFDVMMCALTQFVKNAQPSQWSTSSECSDPRRFAAACPLCPEDCFAPAIPVGSCQACVLLPRSP